MSMVFAISDSKNIVIAADTKVSSTSGLFKYPDIQKIQKINNKCDIGITGQHKYGEILLSCVNNEITENSYPSEIAKIIHNKIPDAVKLWYTKYENLPDCTLIIIGVSKDNSPYFCLITVDGCDINFFETSLIFRKHKFLFANPNDMSFDSCTKISESFILKYEGKSVDEIATCIIKHISTISNVVNNTIDTLTFPLKPI